MQRFFYLISLLLLSFFSPQEGLATDYETITDEHNVPHVIVSSQEDIAINPNVTVKLNITATRDGARSPKAGLDSKRYRDNTRSPRPIRPTLSDSSLESSQSPRYMSVDSPRSEDDSFLYDDFNNEVTRLFKQVLQLPRDHEMTGLAIKGTRKAIKVALKAPLCPISGFQVGCVIEVNRKLYKGVNQEDPSMRNVCCGERSAIWGARPKEGIVNESMTITESFVVCYNPKTKEIVTDISSSCGLCRQTYVLCGNPKISFAHGGRWMQKEAHDLLPYALSWIPVNKAQQPVTLKGIEEHLTFIKSLPRIGIKELTPEHDELIRAALKSARAASADYHPMSEGVALRVENDEFANGYKIFTAANYQNASFGASNSAVGCVYPQAKLELKLNGIKQSIYKMFVLVALDATDTLLSNVSPSGLDRQIAVEEEGGLDTRALFIWDKHLRCESLEKLLPHAFTFKSYRK